MKMSIRLWLKSKLWEIHVTIILLVWMQTIRHFLLVLSGMDFILYVIFSGAALMIYNQYGKKIALRITRKWLKQIFGFAAVGFCGTVLNGFVYSVLSLFPAFRGVPLPWWIFGQITWAWGFGILVGFVFNFTLDKKLVFKA